MLRKHIAIVGAVAASVSIVWISAADAQTEPPPSTIPSTIAPTTTPTRPPTTRPPQPTTTNVIRVTTSTTPRKRTTTTTRRNGGAPTTIAGVVTPTTIASDTTTPIDSTTSTSIERTTTSRTSRTTAPALLSKKNDKPKLLLFAALAAGGVALIGLIAWGLSRRNGPGADGPYLVLDDRPVVFEREGLLLDEQTSGPGGDPFGPIALDGAASRPARPAKQTRATYKRKPKAQPHLTDEDVSAVVAPGAPVAQPQSKSKSNPKSNPNPNLEPDLFFPPERGAEPFFPRERGAEPVFPTFDPFVLPDSDPPPPPPALEPEPSVPPAPEPVAEAPQAVPTSPTPPRQAVPEIEDIDLAVPMDLSPEDVSMDIDLADPQ